MQKKMATRSTLEGTLSKKAPYAVRSLATESEHGRRMLYMSELIRNSCIREVSAKSMTCCFDWRCAEGWSREADPTRPLAIYNRAADGWCLVRETSAERERATDICRLHL